LRVRCARWYLHCVPERKAKPRKGAGTSAQDLIGRGVDVRVPASVEIGPEVDPSNIAPGAVIHAGCRIRGASTSIGPRCEIGREAPATVEDCALGHGVSLKGGYFAGSVFFDGAAMGSAAHVRPGTILEERSGAGHSVGFKQTILFPYVTGGSLINFCDILMAGGTGPDNHGEIGSSYVHFNFTPHGDKATASLLGDVPRGVMLDRPPVFLGGQGGMVGPVRIGFGCVVPAGTMVRRDSPDEGRLHIEAPPHRSMSVPFSRGAYRRIGNIVRNCVNYIGQLHALKAWYLHVRVPAMEGDRWRLACCRRGAAAIDLVIGERISRMSELAGNLEGSVAQLKAGGSGEMAADELAVQQRFIAAWPAMKTKLSADLSGPASQALGRFQDARSGDPRLGYLESVKSWSEGAKSAGRAWLQGIVDRVNANW